MCQNGQPWKESYINNTFDKLTQEYLTHLPIFLFPILLS